MIAALGQVKTRVQAMNGPDTLSLADEFAAAQAWWREAGVDCAFSDEPVSWLTPFEAGPVAAGPEEVASQAPAKSTPSPAAAPPPPIRLATDRLSWPQRLEDFAPWWLDEPSLTPDGTSPRVAPRGMAGARLMVLIPEPEAGDSDSLMSGPQGQFLAAVLRAMGIAEEETYFAAALPRHTPMADWATLAAAGLGDILRHHVALAAPERVLVLGGAILPLLGHDPAQNPAVITEIAHESGVVPTLAAWDLVTMLGQPRQRALFWRRWLEWTDPAEQ